MARSASQQIWFLKVSLIWQNMLVSQSIFENESIKY